MRAWILPVFVLASQVFMANATALPANRLDDPALLARKTCTDCEQEPQYSYDTAGIAKEGCCRVFTTNQFKTRSEMNATCSQKCGNATVMEAKANSNGVLAGTSCVQIQPTYPGGIDPDGDPYTMGNCVCNIPLLTHILEEVVIYLPYIADIGCEIMMDALGTVLAVGAQAIPGVGEEMDAGMAAGVTAAKTMSKYGKKASDFLGYINPCGPPNNYTQHIDDIFAPLANVPDSVMTAGKCISGCPSTTFAPPSVPPPTATPSPTAMPDD